jgi:hypothetical protein
MIVVSVSEAQDQVFPVEAEQPVPLVLIPVDFFMFEEFYSTSERGFLPPGTPYEDAEWWPGDRGEPFL